MYISANDATVDFHMSPDSYISFVDEKAKNKLYTGTMDSNGIFHLLHSVHIDGFNDIDADDEKLKGTYGDTIIREYVPLMDDFSNYSLKKNRRGEYIMTLPNGGEYTFDRKGRLIKCTDETGQH